ncbi:hypothetical protein [Streptococcus orisratti]|uniref:hypothetical protein n=1 Tax=Streptococcus orisratti TaxID=114652 RepID=UPI00294259B2|nr:hypothetical protein [Streptococcus orisratti]
MADGKVTIAVDLDGKKAQGDINSLKSSLSGLGSTFKSVLGANLVSGALMSGVNALAGGIKGAFSSAMSEGAKLQQSIGGIETLFKGSAGTVKQYASEAFKTAGVSANEYMENVTSFSASLISSLGGDTAAAADLANTALMDMSDNANKMGSDMQVITQTYQSLARGNYAMLDNLKLGYGGTKAEMQRLIKDAASYKDVQEELNMTVDEGDMSFANMVKAISVVQKKLGITGTTAKEASETFSGSFASMHAAFKDFLGNLTTGGDITKPLANLAKTASTFVFRNFIPMVGNAFKALPKAISTFISSAKPEIEAGLKRLLPETTVAKIMGFISTIESGVSKVKQTFDKFKDTGAITAVGTAFSAVKDAIGHVFSSLSSSAPDISQIGTALGEVVNWLSDAAKKGAEFISSLPPETIKTIAGAVLGAVAAFKGFKTVSGIIKGVTGAFNLLKAALSANPFMMVVVAIGALVGWFITAYNTSETFRAKVDGVVNSVKKFIDSLDIEQLKSWGLTIAAIAGGFAGFKMLNGWNPFKMFSKNGKDALDSVGDALDKTSGKSRKAKGIITQVFTGLGNLIKSAGQRIATAAKGIGTGLSTAFKGLGTGIATAAKGIGTALSTVATGFGRAAAMANPAQWLSMGAAMLMVGAGVALVASGIYVLVQAAIQLGNAGTSAQLAMVGLGVGIALLAGVFALLGPALTASAVGIVAFGAAVALIGAGIAIAALGLSVLVNAFANAEGAITATGNAISTAAQGIGTGIQSALSGIAGIITSIGGAIKAALQGIADIFTGIGKGIGEAAKGIGDGIKSVFEGVKGIIDSIGGVIKAALEGIAKVFKSMGQAALDAGTGIEKAANAISKLTHLNAGDMANTLYKAADGLKKIAESSSGLETAGSGLSSLASSMTVIAAASTASVIGLTLFSATITTLSTTLTALPNTITTAASGFANFTTQAVSGVAGLTAINTPIAMFKAQIMTITPALVSASAGFALFSSQTMLISVAFSAVGGLITAFNAQIMTVTATMMIASSYFTMISSLALMASSGIATISTATSSLSSALSIAGSSATTFVNQMMMLGVGVSGAILSAVGAVTAGGAQMSVAMRSAGSQMVSSTQSFMNQIVSTVRNGMNNVVTATRSGGSQMVSAMRMAGSQLVTTVQSAVNQAANAARNGYSSFQSAGSYMGQGLAVGMRSALGAVTAAANELVAQAERAAQAKAKIHSPSRLFRDAVGWWIGLGVAKGIDQSTVKVDDAISGMFDKINAFSFKAENVLGVGNSNISHSITTKVMREQAMRVTTDNKNAQTDAYYLRNNNLLENLLDKVYDLEKIVEKGKQIVLDNGTLVGETKDYYDEAIGMNTAMKRRHQL